MNEIKKHILQTAAAKHWEKIGIRPHHGIVLPLFSLRCEKSSGTGEYLDLKQVIDWCKNIGFDVIQLLPLNETASDPSPYNATSSCALNPIHISLHALEGIKNDNNFKEKLNQFKIFNTYPHIHYLQLKRLKMEFLYEYYLYIFDDLKNDKDFQKFIKNHPWLDEFCLYRSIQEQQNYKTWDLWPKELQNIDIENISKYIEKYKNEMNFYYTLQYICFKQLEEVKKYADKNNILLFGDVPILVSKNSCDVWFNKSIFNQDLIAGAPPDSYSLYGQKWGFPLFNWKHLKHTNYQWWQRRLNAIANLYHMYRVDHSVGFFRIWSMHFDEDATEGRFFPRDPAIWNKNGRERLLMLLHSSPLLPIAEDLGLIPKIVYKTLKELGICGTKVIPWEKTIFGYIKFNNYEPLSVTTISTHDSDTFQGWWRIYPKGSTKFAKCKNWHFDPHLTYLQRKELLKDSHNTSSIFHINLLQEYLALYPGLVWDDPDKERINIPGTLEPTNWSYRFRPSFEEIINHKNLQKDLMDILS